MKKNICSIFALGSILVCCFLFYATTTLAVTEEAVQPPNFKRVFITVLVSAFIFGGLVYWYKVVVERINKKDNIAQLKLLSRGLFDSFNNLLKDGGLLEEGWKSLSVSEKDDEEFWKIFFQTRNIMVRESIEDLLVAFESTAEYFKDLKVSPQVMDNCERDGLSLIIRLLGYDFAKMEFLRLNHVLVSASGRCWASLEDDLFMSAHDNIVDISSFEIQLNQVREFLLSRSDLHKPPGLLASIDKLSNLIRDHAS